MRSECFMDTSCDWNCSIGANEGVPISSSPPQTSVDLRTVRLLEEQEQVVGRKAQLQHHPANWVGSRSRSGLMAESSLCVSLAHAATNGSLSELRQGPTRTGQTSKSLRERICHGRLLVFFAYGIWRAISEGLGCTKVMWTFVSRNAPHLYQPFHLVVRVYDQECGCYSASCISPRPKTLKTFHQPTTVPLAWKNKHCGLSAP